MAQKLPTVTVSEIDRSTVEFFSRDPDRPGRRRRKAKPKDDGTAKRRRRSKPAELPDIKRAKTRRRVAAWRQRNDMLRRPETDRIGVAALDALLRSLSKLDDVSAQQHLVVAGMIVELKAEGYDLRQVLQSMRSRRSRLLAADSKA